jgi:hypothetical protein
VLAELAWTEIARDDDGRASERRDRDGGREWPILTPVADANRNRVGEILLDLGGGVPLVTVPLDASGIAAVPSDPEACESWRHRFGRGAITNVCRAPGHR